jgi:hypothetical protein
MSIGYEDATVAYARTGRAPLEETVTFIEHRTDIEVQASATA